MDAIQKIEQTRRNIYNSFSNKDELEKGMSSFIYDDSLKFPKMGSEIISLLEAKKMKLEGEYSACNQVVSALSGVLERQPSIKPYYEDCDCDELEGLLVYGDEYTYWNEINAPQFGENKSPISGQVEANNYKSHNQAVYRMINCKGELKIVDTLLKNLDQNKEYILSMRQVQTLEN